MSPLSTQYTKYRQKGTALIVALIFLLILTILGVTAMGTSTLEEKMAGNAKEQNLAFQSAEAALRAGELWLQTQISKPTFPNVANGLYVTTTTAVEVWDSVNWDGANVVVYPGTPGAPATGALGDVSTMPKYIIEDLGEVPEEGGSKVMPTDYKGKGATLMRITARGTGGTDSAVSMVQSAYQTKF
jgi:type IV pilus assembly protein PilX